METQEAVAPELAGAEPQPAPEEPTYWAAKPDKDDIGTEIAERAQEFYQTIQESGLLDLWRNTHAQFYGLSTQGGHETSTIIEFGDDGEKLGVRVNHLRALVRYVHATATADRPLIQPRAVNSTAKAMAQIPTARRVLEYYLKTQRLERHLRGVALRALLYGKGYLWQTWDPSAAQGKGDLVYRACSPLEVACDLERDANDHDWYVIRRPRNRHDVAAVFAKGDQELADNILAVEKDILEGQMSSKIAFGLHRKHDRDTDTIYEYHFMHRKTPALPEGRYVIMVGKDLVLFDGPLPFDDVPVAEMVPEEFLEAGSVGYASAWDLLGMQEAYDALLSTCITNFDAFAHQDLLIPDGVELGVEEVRDGLSVIRFPPGEFNKPSILDKFSLREEVFKLRDWIKNDMELTSGVNSVARGEPEASLKSGNALALVQAQAVHFQSAFVGAYTTLIEDVGTQTIRLLKQYADQPRLAAIAGSNDSDGLKAFSSQDLDQIDRIDCELGNPVFRTLGGKFDMANNLLERGLIKDINQYFQVIESGRTEPVNEPHRKSDLRVQEENELLMQGPPSAEKPGPAMPGQPPQLVPWVPTIPAVLTDNPATHIPGHASVLDSDDCRNNPQVAAAVIAHIQEHLTVWRNAPPDLLLLLGYPLPPPLPGMTPNPAANMIAAQHGAPQGQKPPGPAGKTQDQGAKPPEGGAQDAGQAPDKGSGMPSLPKPAQPPQPPGGT